MKRIALKGGPRDGRSYDVPDSHTELHVSGGKYVIHDGIGKWYGNAATHRSTSKPKQYDAGGIMGATPTAVIIDEAAAATTVTNTTGAPELVLDAESQAALTGYVEGKAAKSKPAAKPKQARK